MKGGWPGFLAVILFLILILLFLASAATPEITADPQLFTSNGAAPIMTPTINSSLPIAPTALLIVNSSPSNTAQPLIIPTLQAGSAVYVVQPGDWLSAIARRHNTTVQAILALNPQLANPDALQPGDTLVLP